MSNLHAHILIESGPADDRHTEIRSVGDRWVPEIERVTADLRSDAAVATVLPCLDDADYPSMRRLVTISLVDGGPDLRVTAIDSLGARTVILYDPTSVGQALGFARVWLDTDALKTLPIIGFAEKASNAH